MTIPGSLISTLFAKTATAAPTAAPATSPVALSYYTAWNPNDKGSSTVLSNNNLTAASNLNSSVRSVTGVSTGKHYFEVTGSSGSLIGVGSSAAAVQGYRVYPGGEGSVPSWSLFLYDGSKYASGVNSAYYNGRVSSAVGVKLDMDAGTLSFVIDGVDRGIAYSGLSGLTLYAMVGGGSSGAADTITANFGASAFTYPVPAGYRSGFGTVLVTTSTDADPYYSSVPILLSSSGFGSSTSIIDSSPLPNTITSTGVTLSTAQSKWGGSSMYFGSSNGNYLTLGSPVNFGTGNFTIEGWIYPTAASTSSYSVLFGNSGQGAPQTLIYYADGSVGYYNGIVFYRSAASKLSFNQWNHYAIVRQGNSFKIYINGVDVGLSITDTAAVTINIIGAYGGNPANYNVIGYMDDIRFTTGVARYTANFAVPTAAYPNASLAFTLIDPNAFGTPDQDQFGNAVAIDGNYTVVGAFEESDAGGINSGKAYIYNTSTGALLWTLNNPNAYGSSQYDSFGTSVAVSGNYVLIGAPNESDAGGTYSGKVYVFNATTGALSRTLINPNAFGTSALDFFGMQVAVSGNYAIVGAQNEKDPGGIVGTASGKAYIFDITTGALLWTLNNPNAYGNVTNDTFGYSVGISGNYAIVGTPNEGDAFGAQSGKAYIFSVETGNRLWILDNPNPYGTSAQDYFGNSVAISGNYAIVGAYGEDDAGGLTSGKAYIYNVATGALLRTLNNPSAYGTSAGDYFGNSVAISGNYAVVAAYQEDDVSGGASGKAYIFDVTTGALVKTLSDPNAYGTSLNDNFGVSVAISGNYAIVGASLEDSVSGTSSGAAYIYQLPTLLPTYSSSSLAFTLNDPNAYGTPAEDYFGSSAAVDGKYAIIGAAGESSGSGLYSGKAYIFDVTTGSKLFTLDNPMNGQFGQFGTSVAISGNYAVVGTMAPGNAYIYNVVSGTLLYSLNNPNPYGTTENDQFGRFVAISSKYTIVSAMGERSESSVNYPVGKVYIYDNATGNLLRTLTGATTNNYFGISVAVYNNYVAVGSWNPIADSPGKVFTYDITNGNLLYTLSGIGKYGWSIAMSGNYLIVGAWEDYPLYNLSVHNVTTGELLRAIPDPLAGTANHAGQFGYSVSISGKYAVVGDQYGPNGTQSGNAYIFDVTTGALIRTLDNPNPVGTPDVDMFGAAVAISGNYVISTAMREDLGYPAGLNAGKAYIYTLS